MCAKKRKEKEDWKEEDMNREERNKERTDRKKKCPRDLQLCEQRKKKKKKNEENEYVCRVICKTNKIPHAWRDNFFLLTQKKVSFFCVNKKKTYKGKEFTLYHQDSFSAPIYKKLIHKM